MRGEKQHHSESISCGLYLLVRGKILMIYSPLVYVLLGNCSKEWQFGIGNASFGSLFPVLVNQLC